MAANVVAKDAIAVVVAFIVALVGCSALEDAMAHRGPLLFVTAHAG